MFLGQMGGVMCVCVFVCLCVCVCVCHSLWILSRPPPPSLSPLPLENKQNHQNLISEPSHTLPPPAEGQYA
jgi:hypothetical protein